ncbi:hypothetical protein ACFQX7_31050, partial [Luedemannella flava]
MLLTERHLPARYLGFNKADGWSSQLLLLSFLRQVSAAAYKAADLIAPGTVQPAGGRSTAARTEPHRDRLQRRGPGRLAPAGPKPLAPTVSWAGRVDRSRPG